MDEVRTAARAEDVVTQRDAGGGVEGEVVEAAALVRAISGERAMAHGEIGRPAECAAVVNPGAEISRPDVTAKGAMRDVQIADAPALLHLAVESIAMGRRVGDEGAVRDGDVADSADAVAARRNAAAVVG